MMTTHAWILVPNVICIGVFQTLIKLMVDLSLNLRLMYLSILMQAYPVGMLLVISKPLETDEEDNYINYLEFLAVFFAFLFLIIANIHVRLKLDNSTAFSYIDNMEGIKSELLNTLSRQIWKWCLTI